MKALKPAPALSSRCVIYVRVSSAEQVERYSLDIQEAVCREMCVRNGWDVVEVYREEGESAKTADRTQLNRVLARIAKRGHGIGRLVIYDLSRFTRETFDLLTVQRALQAAGVLLVSAAEHIDDTPAGEFVSTVITAANQLENRQRRAKSMAGMQEALRRGVWTWLAPFGYVNQRTPDGRATMVPDEKTAPFVRRVFERLGTGYVTQEDARAELRQLGLTIARTSFAKLVRNPIYCGRLVAKEWGIETASASEGLVSEDLFDRVQAILHRESSGGWTRTENTPLFPLRYWTRCVEHDSPLTAYLARGRHGGKYPYYRCTRRPSCQNVRAERVEEAFRSLLRSLTCRRELAELWLEIVRDAWEIRNASSREATRGLRAKLRALEEKETRLLEAFVDGGGTIPADVYRRQQVRLASERDQLRDALGCVPQVAPLEPSLAVARALMQTPERTWDSVHPADRHRFVRIVFPASLHLDPKKGFRTPAKSLYAPLLGAISGGGCKEWYPQGDQSQTPEGLESEVAAALAGYEQLVGIVNAEAARECLR